MLGSKLNSKKRMIFILIVVNIIWIILIIRVGIIQFIEGEKWKTRSENQQYVSRSIIAGRGTIFDSSGEIILAQSSTVETVTVNPVNISAENKEKVSKALSEIFELDYEKVLKKVNRNSSIETIVKRVDKEKTDQLRVWMEENNLYTGINIDEDTKRYYPYSTLASHIIGFVGSDNQGLDGIEAKYDKVLTGENGSISKMLDAKGNIIGDSGEEYEKATQGNDIILTIDMNIQAIAEKYLQQACIENVCTDGGNVILMNPQNGDILAMATYPFYDLNDPYTINNDEIQNIWSELDSSQKNTYLQGMWRNKAIADTYEPRFNF
ncbi:MAG TPA: hypothetical protein IAD08_05735 [Candidatus Scatovivens faecipullorum]|nr:hypothetical protein [Candidatus Scatovivens faecipullorum]